MLEIHGIRSGRNISPGKYIIVIREGHMLYPPYPFVENHTVNKERYYNYFTKKLIHRKEVNDWFEEKADLYIKNGHLQIWGPHAGEKQAGNDGSWLSVIETELVNRIRIKRKKQYNKR